MPNSPAVSVFKAKLLIPASPGWFKFLRPLHPYQETTSIPLFTNRPHKLPHYSTVPPLYMQDYKVNLALSLVGDPVTPHERRI
jgi:hypothetical protein